MTLRLPGRIRPSTLAAAGATLLIAVLATTLISSGPAKTVHPQQARSFTLSQLGDQGKRISLTAYAGRPVVLNFFASWCTPCQRETPLLAQFYRSHRGHVLIIGIDANDHLGSASSFVRSRGVAYPVAFDPSASVTVSYGVGALPQTLFLNARHQIVRHIYGALTLAELNSWAASISHRIGT